MKRRGEKKREMKSKGKKRWVNRIEMRRVKRRGEMRTEKAMVEMR